MLHFLPKSTLERGLSMDALQQRSVPFSAITNTSSCGTPSESGDSHQIKFTYKEGCTPTACACVILAILFVSLGAAAGVYFGLQFLDLGKRTERVYKGSFVIVGGDKYTSNLADTLSEEFQEKAQAYKARLDKLYNNSVYKNIYLQSEILALNKKDDDKNLIVHFNLHLSPDQSGLSAADLYVVLSEEVMRSRTGVFRDIKIDQDSIQIQERKPPVDDVLDRWVPRRQYPGYVEGLTTTPSSALPRIVPRQCSPLEVSFCNSLPYNTTSYPNIVGHNNMSEVMNDIVMFRQILDFECYPLAQEFVCQLLQPDCEDDDIIMPCKDFCEDFWRSCKKLLPKKVIDKIDCSKFPKFSGYGTCHQKPGCSNELRALGMSDRLCDGVVDCKDSSDETNCDYCKPGQFICGDRQCVDKDRRCDLREDCLNGVDERNCMSISPSNWGTKESFYSYSSSGFLLYSDSGENARICSDNLNYSLPETRRDVILQSLAVSTCSALNFEVTENVEMRKDVNAVETDYVQLLDPLASSITFVQVSCDSQNVVYVKCGASACGLRPAHSARVARSYALNLPEGKFGAVHGQWPWQVALFKNGEYACDATLVSDDWILTSTACFESDPHAVWVARIGIIRLSSKSPFDQESRITGMVKSPIGSGVLSILKLEQSINGSDYVRPSCLPSHNYSLAGIPCNTLRWSVRKNHLFEVKLTITGNDCTDETLNNTSTRQKLICALESDVMEDEECQGDEAEGSPLLCNINDKWYILGVSNQKVTCPSSNKQRRYHHTFEHVQWIRHTLESLRVH
ncbi:atrial natriuretic peptide-converting enzyme-like isoform X3 [Argiope bruennichi]|uniref:atrial natriuretic peptide-converting enzyme-like isoform X3 n=2 Tax=Argiope bruennichi TaxID=94029 RepID=UPI0024952223|nr:atrial natriuretic peptide-converting enzyme-like isoform X3 [Argiope bruennichi]